MRPISLTVTGVNSSSVAPMNIHTAPFNVGFGVTLSGTLTFTVQHTFDDVFSPTFNPATANWFPHSVVANATAAADGNYAFPVAAIRIIGVSGSGTATIRLIQAGIQ